MKNIWAIACGLKKRLGKNMHPQRRSTRGENIVDQYFSRVCEFQPSYFCFHVIRVRFVCAAAM